MSDKETKSIIDTFADTEELNDPVTQEVVQKRSLFLERYKYIPLYILGLLLYWAVASILENFLNDDDIIVYAFIPSVPIVLLVIALNSKIKNRWVFHSLLALFGAPLWMLLLTPLIMMYIAVTLF